MLETRLNKLLLEKLFVRIKYRLRHTIENIKENYKN
jgi:hypothetical protein